MEQKEINKKKPMSLWLAMPLAFGVLPIVVISFVKYVTVIWNWLF